MNRPQTAVRPDRGEKPSTGRKEACIGDRHGRDRSEMDMTPMVDVTFLLLI